MRQIFNWTLILLVVLLSGCSSGGGGNGSSNTIVSPAKTDTFVAGSGAQTFNSGSVKIDVPTAAFSQNATITLNQYSSSASFPLPAAARENHLKVSNILEINASATPLKNISLTLPASPDKQTIVGLYNGVDYICLPNSRNGTTITITLPNSVTSSQAMPRGIGNTIWQIIKGDVSSIDEVETALKTVVGNGGKDGLSVIGVHGILSTYNKMDPIVKAACQQLGARNGYSLSYNWIDATKSGIPQYLANQLNSFPEKSVILIGHSYGCIVSREALEQLSATKAVKAVWLVAGPNTGTLVANVADLPVLMATQYLNGGFDGPTGDSVMPVSDEMLPGSQFLRNLNTAPTGQLGNVAYYLFAGNSKVFADGMVGVDSARARNINLAAFTNGPVFRQTLDGANHSGIVSNSNYVNDIINFYKKNGVTANALTLEVFDSRKNSVGNNTIDVNTEGYWRFELVLKNTSNTRVEITDLDLQSYFKSGSFYDNAWYTNTGPGEVFPNKYCAWQFGLDPGKQTTLYISQYTNSQKTPVWIQTNQELLALSLIPVVRYTANGISQTQQLPTVKFVWQSQGLSPNPAQTRAVIGNMAKTTDKSGPIFIRSK